MSEKGTSRRERLDGFSWAMWAERAVVRALDIPPSETIEGALLHGERTSHVALTIARAVGYVAGTQRAPELPEALRAWLDAVAMGDRPHEGARLGGLSWSAWAQRASVLALEIEEGRTVDGVLLRGLPLWKVAVTVARAVAYLSGAERAPELAAGLRLWLQGGPGVASCAGVEERAS